MPSQSERRCSPNYGADPCAHVLLPGVETARRQIAEAMWLVGGSTGMEVLKEQRPYLSRTEHRLRAELQSRLAEQSVHVARVLGIRECASSARQYELQEFVDGSACDRADSRHVELISRALASLHACSQRIVGLARPDFAHLQPRDRFGKTSFTWPMLLDAAPNCAEADIGRLWKAHNEAAENVPRSARGNGVALCHGDPDPTNAVIVDDHCVLIDFDDMHVDTPASDLAWLLLTFGAICRGGTMRQVWDRTTADIAWRSYASVCESPDFILEQLPHYLVASVCCGLVDQLFSPSTGWRVTEAELAVQCSNGLELVESSPDLVRALG